MCGKLSKGKRICATALAVIASVGMTSVTAFAANTSDEYVVDEKAGEEFVQSVLDKKDEWYKKMQDIENKRGDSYYFWYTSWFQDLDLDGVPEFLTGGRTIDGTKYFYIYDKNGNAYFMDQNVGIRDVDWGYDAFGYKLYRDIKTGELVYLANEDAIKKLNYSSENGFSEEILCSEEYNESTDSTTYKIGSETVDKAAYDKYCSTLSRYVPVITKHKDFTAEETDKDTCLDSYNTFDYVIPTAENAAEDMVYMTINGADLFVEELVGNPFEIYDVENWSYEHWFEDLNMDGVPDFVAGGIIDTTDNKHIRYYDVMDLFNDNWIDGSQVNENHGNGNEGFGYKLYEDKETGNRVRLAQDSFSDGDSQTYVIRQLYVLLDDVRERDLCSAVKSGDGTISYTIEGKTVSEEEFNKFIDELNEKYKELSVNIKVIGQYESIYDEDIIKASYDAASVGEAIEGTPFALNFSGKTDKTEPDSSGDTAKAVTTSKAQNSKSSANPSTGASETAGAVLAAAALSVFLIRGAKNFKK